LADYFVLSFQAPIYFQNYEAVCLH